jgi:hypothetical protein
MSFVSCRVRSRFFPCAPTDERCLVQTLEHFDAGVRDDHPDATLLVSPYDSQKRDQYSRGSNLRGGTNGDRLREIDVVALPLIPLLYPDCLLRGRRRSGVGHYATVVKEPRNPRAQWAELAARAEREGLRRVARDSVSPTKRCDRSARGSDRKLRSLRPCDGNPGSSASRLKC